MIVLAPDNICRRLPAGAAAALVFAHDPRMITRPQTDRVCPLLESHFRPTWDPATLKRGRDDDELSHGNHLSCSRQLARRRPRHASEPLNSLNSCHPEVRLGEEQEAVHCLAVWNSPVSSDSSPRRRRIFRLAREISAYVAGALTDPDHTNLAKEHSAKK